MIYPRRLEHPIGQLIGRNKVILILGSRRVGKTVLIDRITKNYNGQWLLLNAEDYDVQHLLEKRSAANYRKLVGDARLLIIDEGQAIPEIGAILKLMIDSINDLTIIATGSSSFDLLNRTGEPLTGRAYNFTLYPLAQLEIGPTENLLQTTQNLDDRLVFGSYPEVVNLASYKEKTDYLLQLTQSYLLKDILSLDGIRNADKITRLLQLVAHQVGNEVSYTELGQQLSMSKNTVERYLDLLSKVFIVFKLSSYSTNPRSEISKGSKWYFCDNGIRNACMQDLRPLPLRNDTGPLWENYLIAERLKKNAYLEQQGQYFFWRTFNKQEIDFVEIRNGKLAAFEFKYSPTKSAKVPPAFATQYPDAPFTRISKDNYLDWITG
ncbi:MAG: ATP-binding protein [Bacteroidetes bacterium]|nr:ATP-binding protein [Bacteroidota bacterium]